MSTFALVVPILLGLNGVLGQGHFKVTMPGAVPTENDNYLCHAFKVTELVGQSGPIYINQFSADSDASKAHHIILQSCKSVGAQAKEQKTWDCRHHAACEDGEEILFAWARRAPPTHLPADVTFKLDPNETPYLVLQVHYVHKLEEQDFSTINVEYQPQPSRYSAGIYLMMRTRLTIPGRNAVTHGDMNCIVRKEMHPFAFRTHAHKWGTVITGYKYDTRTNEMTEFARGNPQWPQAFYPVSNSVTLNPGDFFVGRCTYNTTDNPDNTYIGSTGGDEMCNLYVMYYSEEAHFEQCFDEQSVAISAKLPLDSDVPPPRNEDLENVAAGRTKGDLDFAEPSKDDNNGVRKKGPLDAPEVEDQSEVIRFNMPGAVPQSDDSYLCTTFQVWNLTKGREMYIKKFQADATALKAHHIILQRCDNPPQAPGKIWNCIHHSTCNGANKILFAWAKDAPPTILPDDVGFKIGESSREHLVLQVHYSHPLAEADYTGLTLQVTDKKPLYTAGILLLWSGYLDIPPHQVSVHGDINCRMNIKSPMYLFAYRTHAHGLSTVITGYKYRDNHHIEFARGDPQKPQTFYPMKKIEDVRNGDYISARCTYNTTMKDTHTQIGATAGDEMCNLYIMYYTASEKDDYMTCSGIDNNDLVNDLPKDSDVPIQLLNREQPMSYANSQNEINPNHYMSPKEKKQYGNMGGNYGQYMPPPVYQQPPQLPSLPYSNLYPMSYSNQLPYPNYYAPNTGEVDNTNQQPDPAYAYSNGLSYYPSQGPSDQDTTTVTTAPSSTTSADPKSKNKKPGNNREGKNLPDAGLYTVPNWPPPETMKMVGQPTGITLDIYDNPVIFHRGDRVWDGSTFNGNNVYNGDKKKPIEGNTILTLKKEDGTLLNAWGARMFFMPHMVTIDSENNVWVTDVAMHQVFQFPPYGGKDGQPNIVLGQPFEPGSDDLHYCKPTSVAVMKDSRTFFVADGYCNSRIIQYTYEITRDGHHNVSKLNSWGVANGAGLSFSKSPYSLNVPHGLALAEDKKLLCVADRENGRVQCFSTDNGRFSKSIQPAEFGRTIYSVAYASKTGRIYAVGGPEDFGFISGKKTQGYIYDLDSDTLVNTFNSADEGFKMPHDVAVTADGSLVYVVEINPFKVWKLSSGKPSTILNPASPPSTNPNGSAADYISKLNLKTLENMVPSTNMGIAVVVASVLFTCAISICISCRKCKKRGKGKTVKPSKTYKKDAGKLDLGDLLGRSKEGFQPLNTEDDDAVLISSDSDVEDFSVPALHT